MKQPEVSDLRNLVSEIVIPFYEVERATPLPSNGSRHENDAEHSWSLALLACALAPHIDSSLNVGLVAQFATIHDLTEVYAGDTSNHAPTSEKALKEEREAAALGKIVTKLAVFPWITQSLLAYEAQDTPEAQFVKSVDKILPLIFDYLNQGQLYKDKQITQEEWIENMQLHRQKASKHPGVFVYYEQLWDQLLANPDFFYQRPTSTKP